MKSTTSKQENWEGLSEILEKGVETLPQLLAYQARRFGNRVFYKRKDLGLWREYVWEDVLEKVKTFAMGLASLGIKAEDTVAVLAKNEPQLFWSEYAAQAVGAKVVCLDPDLTSAQTEYMLIHSKAVIAVCEDQEQVDKIFELEKKLPGIDRIIYWNDRGMWKYHHAKLMTFKQAQEQGRAYLREHPGRFEEVIGTGKGTDVAVLSYTSGTTGPPKGCPLTHANLLDRAFRLFGAFSPKPFTHYLSYISPARPMEQVFGVTLGLLCPFVVYFPEDPETVRENMGEIGTEAVVLSPVQWEGLASLVKAKMLVAGPIRRAIFRSGMAVGEKMNLPLLQGKKARLRLRFLYFLADRLLLSKMRAYLGFQETYFTISEGSSMAPDVFRFFHTLGVRLRNSFGTTEMGLLTAHQGDSYDLETVGKWLPVHPRFGPPLECRVTDEGEFSVTGGSGFSGYYRDEEATAKRNKDGWFYTGDAVRRTNKGEFIYIDRVDDIRHLSTGHSYSPQFIESRLRSSAFVKDAIIVGNHDKSFVSVLVNIDAVTVGLWAEQRKIGYTTFTDLSQDPAILELIEAEIKKVNDLLPEALKVKRFINLPKELDPDEDEVSRTRKFRRSFFEQKYQKLIAAMYSGEDEVRADLPIRYQDGRVGVVNATVHIRDTAEEGREKR